MSQSPPTVSASQPPAPAGGSAAGGGAVTAPPPPPNAQPNAAVTTGIEPPDIVASEQLFQARMKAHDVTQEHLKQIITVASATLVLTLAFLKDVIGGRGSEIRWPFLLPLSWLALGAAIVLAILSIALLVNNLDAADETIGRDQKYAIAFAVSPKWSVRVAIMLSVITFSLGMFSLGTLGAVNFNVLLTKEVPGYRILTEAQALERVQKMLPANSTLVSLRRAELVKDEAGTGQGLLRWDLRLTIQQPESGTVGTGVNQDRSYQVDAFTGQVREEK